MGCDYIKHGESYTRLHHIWDGMKARCYNPNNPSYGAYGARGIYVCEQWLNDYMAFSMWAKSHGYHEHLTIDRIDNCGPYSPENCRWADKKAQANNTRNCVWYEFRGETHTLAEWADIVKIPKRTLWNRLKMYGWDIEATLTTPVAKRKNNAQTYNTH